MRELISVTAGYGTPSFPLCCFMSWTRTYSASSRTSEDLQMSIAICGLGGEWRIAGFDATVTALILAGRRERARELIDSVEAQPGNKERWQTWVRNQRSLLDQDAASLGAEFRLQEEKVAKFHRLGDAWEPSPFPIEVPDAERAQRCDEPPFPARPWIVPPPGLVNAPPTQPGEVRFASKSLRRRGGLVLVVALTREEAAERHRARQDYVLAMRRPDESLLVVRHHTGWSRTTPSGADIRTGIFTWDCTAPQDDYCSVDR